MLRCLGRLDLVVLTSFTVLVIVANATGHLGALGVFRFFNYSALSYNTRCELRVTLAFLRVAHCDTQGTTTICFFTSFTVLVIVAKATRQLGALGGLPSLQLLGPVDSIRGSKSRVSVASLLGRAL